MNERLIIIGLITSTAFCKRVRPYWSSTCLESGTAKILANWTLEYYDKYGVAPGNSMEAIFYKKVKEGNIDKEIALEIEEDILPDLSEEAEQLENNQVEYLYEQTIQYLNQRKLLQLAEQIGRVVEEKKGSLEERLQQANELIHQYKTLSHTIDESIDLGSEEALKRIKAAFSKQAEPCIRSAKALGEFWNQQFVPGAFVSFLAPEKRGKTWLLLERAMTATRQGKKVAFFQAGDMNEAEQLKRIGMYLKKRPILEKYASEHWQMSVDCIENQMDKCTRKERECDFGVFSDLTENQIRELSADELLQHAADNEDYLPCWNCKRFRTEKLGVPWPLKIPKSEVLETEEVLAAVEQFFIRKKRSFRLSTHANGTLSVKNIVSILDKWETENDFVPDVIIIDYADLLVPSNSSSEYRHQQNQIWKDLRKLSQTKRAGILPCVISPTQADAKAYSTYRLKLDNFSEDKRKFAHVTAMYGLNQDPTGKEKKLGLLRINEIIIREGEYSITNEVTVIQNLRKGRPVIGSYFGK